VLERAGMRQAGRCAALEFAAALCYIFQGATGILSAGKVGEGMLRTISHRCGRVAQLAEHSALNRQVVGSIPTASTNEFN
jgi:hypothetical protein